MMGNDYGVMENDYEMGLSFSSKLDRGICIIFIAKFSSKKIGALIHSLKFLYSEVPLYLYKYTKWPCME